MTQPQQELVFIILLFIGIIWAYGSGLPKGKKTKMDREFTGVLTRNKEKIFVGDTVDTVQGTQFKVVKLQHINGVKYALHDGERPFNLEPWMSPNLWLVENNNSKL